MADPEGALGSHWEPPCDPRVPESGVSLPTTYAGWIGLWLLSWFFVFGALTPLVIAGIGLVKTWGGGTWNP